MTTDNQSQSLRMVHRLPASPERVFDALVNPEAMRKWMFAGEDTKYEVDLRVGGTWSITNRRDGVEYVASGTYLEVDPPRRLVYTFAMLQFSPNSDTITIELTPAAGECIMTFTQAGLDIADELRQVPVGEKGGSETGWEQGFEALTAALR